MAVNADAAPEDNRALAPNATTTIGFVADYTGPNIPPAAFTLNGTLSTTG